VPVPPVTPEVPETPVRLIATDLDGTLLRTDGSVSERTRAALALVEEAGATLVLATGRPPRWIEPIAEQVGHRGYAVCSNGALVYDLHDGRELSRSILSPDIGLAVAKAVRHALPDATFGVEHGHSFGHEPAYAIAGDYGDLYVGKVEELFGRPAVKLLIRHAGYDVDALAAKVAEIAGDLAEYTYSSKEPLIEVAVKGVTKAATLAVLCEQWGIDASEVVAFGDMPNDVGMLSWAGTSYAVGNAHPDALAVVDHVTATNDDDGVARVLERIFG
jgi:Cof subfamily protein (haloacid dehalogenase superfamily)